MLLRYTGVPEGRAAPGCWASPGTTCHRWWSSRAWRSRLPAARLRQARGLDRGAPARPSRLRRERECHHPVVESATAIHRHLRPRWRRPLGRGCTAGWGSRAPSVRFVRRSRPVVHDHHGLGALVDLPFRCARPPASSPDTSKVPGMTTSTSCSSITGPNPSAWPAPLCWQRLADRARRRGRLVALARGPSPRFSTFARYTKELRKLPQTSRSWSQLPVDEALPGLATDPRITLTR